MQVCERCTTIKIPHNDLFETESYLDLPLTASHYRNGRLTLKCVAQIGDLYQQDTDITFTNVKDPIPARGKFTYFYRAIFGVSLSERGLSRNMARNLIQVLIKFLS